MRSVLPDIFERFAKDCELDLRVEAILAAPRDVLTPLADTDQYYLVTVSRTRSAEALRVVFVAPLEQVAIPDWRDVLWWLAADAWGVERSDGELVKWALSYGYSPDDESAARFFRQHVEQARALTALLGKTDYDRLLSLHDAEVTRGKNTHGAG